MTQLTSTESLILGIVREARELGYAPLLRTVLHKLVYLADVYSAESAPGNTFTHQRWTFHHFGPFAIGVAEAMDHLEATGRIAVTRKQNDDGDREFVLYDSTGIMSPGLREISLPKGVAFQLIIDLKKYSRDLPSLLEHVYFGTTPMESVSPGDVLNFESCRPVSMEEVRPIPMTAPSAAVRTRVAKLLQTIAATQRHNSGAGMSPPVIFDNAYKSTISTEVAGAKVDESYDASISFPLKR